MFRVSSSVHSDSPYTIGEIFCGAGGLSLGFHEVGFASTFANDIWPLAIRTYLHNFEGKSYDHNKTRAPIVDITSSIEDLCVKDLLERLGKTGHRNSTEGDLDVLLGGPPCQGFSLNSHKRSDADPRNHLFKEYIRVLRELAPKVFAFENVPGMLSLNGGRFFDDFTQELSAETATCGPRYEMTVKILNAAHYGVPQERYRLLVVGTRSDVAARAGVVQLPYPTHYSRMKPHFKGGRTLTFYSAIGERTLASDGVGSHFDRALLPPTSVYDAISDLPALSNGGGSDLASYESEPVTPFQRQMRIGSMDLHNHWARRLEAPNLERSKHIGPGGDWRDIPHDLLPQGMQRALRKDHTTRYGRLTPTQLSGTVLTKPDPHWGTFLHYDITQQRLISVREAARIQSFPDSHIFVGRQADQYKLCGNAVPPLMARAIANEVAVVLDRYHYADSENCVTTGAVGQHAR